MARKTIPTTTKTTPAKAVKTIPAREAAPAVAPVSTSMRNSPVPKAATVAPSAVKKEVTYEMIARRAYEIYLSGTGGSSEDNWHRAERELRGH